MTLDNKTLQNREKPSGETLGFLKQAFTIRQVEERLLQLFSEGKLFGTVHTCIGQEFSGVAVNAALKPQDYLFSNHRCHGHFLSYGGDAEGLIAEVMGKETGVCGGRGGSQHLCQGHFFSNGIQGGIVPVSAGLAMAQKLRRNGGIAVVFIGDGTLGQGVIYETMNIASKWNLPLLIVLENNQYAQSTASTQTLAGSILERAQAFGIHAATADTWNWEQLVEIVADNVASIRKDNTPRFLEIQTYRLKAHSKGDDQRDIEEVKSYEDRDPLNLIAQEYADNEWFVGMQESLGKRIDNAVKLAEGAGFSQDLGEEIQTERPVEWQKLNFECEMIVSSIRRALDAALHESKEVVLIGEDIESPYGGAFKVCAGLSDYYPDQVRNTPISEPAIVGIGNGLALAGFQPVVEIMFGDFLTLAMDQWLNHAAKFRWMYNEKVTCPIIIRTPMGGRRGYGPTHSQSLEKHFIGVPHTQVLCVHHRYSPFLLYQKLFETIQDPTLVIENKRLYGHRLNPDPPPGFQILHSKEDFPTTWLSPGRPAELTIIALGGVSVDTEKAVLQAFDEHEIIADTFFPGKLYPFDIEFMMESLMQTQRLLLIEEGQGFASLSSEVFAQVMERTEGAGIKCKRLVAKQVPIATSRPLEEKSLPNSELILNEIRKIL